jgi:hypothetical protein
MTGCRPSGTSLGAVESFASNMIRHAARLKIEQSRPLQSLKQTITPVKM